MTKFPLTAAEVETVSGYDLMMALETFWRANGMRTGRNLTAGEQKAEALHWIAKA